MLGPLSILRWSPWSSSPSLLLALLEVSLSFPVVSPLDPSPFLRFSSIDSARRRSLSLNSARIYRVASVSRLREEGSYTCLPVGRNCPSFFDNGDVTRDDLTCRDFLFRSPANDLARIDA